MEFVQSLTTCIRKALVFSGRANRPEFWTYFFFVALMTVGLVSVYAVLPSLGTGLVQDNGPTDFGEGLIAQVMIWLTFALPVPLVFLLRTPILLVAFLLLLVPLLSAGWRRLHDVGWPGWLIAIPLGAQIISRSSFYAMWFLMGDAAPPEGMGANLSVLLMLLSGVAGMISMGGWLALAYFLSRPSAQGDNPYGPLPDLQG